MKRKKYKIKHKYKTVIDLSKDMLPQVDKLVKEYEEKHKLKIK